MLDKEKQEQSRDQKMTPQAANTQRQYLEKRRHSWRQQLYIKGRRLTVSGVWMDMSANGETPEEAAFNWDRSIWIPGI